MPASKAREAYRRKRDFSKTIDPSGRAERETAKPETLRFVVQRHGARRLHYDFRFELDGVLKGWAPKALVSIPATNASRFMWKIIRPNTVISKE